MKKLINSVLVFSPMFAMAADGDVTIDTAAATSALTSITGAISTWFTSAFPIIVGVVGVLLVPWLLRLAIRVVKSLGAAFN